MLSSLTAGSRDQIDEPGPPDKTELSEKWKSISAIRLEEKYRNEAAGCVKAARVLVDKLAGPLSANTLKYSAESAWGEKLNDVVNRAAELAFAMAKQRSRFDLYVPDIADLQREENSNGNVYVWGKIVDIEDGCEINGRIAYVVI